MTKPLVLAVAAVILAGAAAAAQALARGVVAWGDVPTWGLLAGAAVTAWYAARAFRAQSQELGVLRTEVEHGQTMIGQQAKLIEIQAGQLDEQRKLTAEQIGVLELQRRDLEASLAQREREADERRAAQAAMVATWFGSVATPMGIVWGSCIRNASHLPVFHVRVFFHYVQEQGSDWTAIDRGGPPLWIRVIPPGGERFAEIPETIRNMVDHCDEQMYVTSLEFTDAAEVRWRRDARGGLIRLN